jgi:hypothetical protein
MTKIYNGFGFGLGQAEQKSITFTGAANLGAVGVASLFTVTGAVVVRLVAICTADLVDGVGDALIGIGIAGEHELLCEDILAVNVDGGMVWEGAVPPAAHCKISDLAVTNERVLANGQDIFATIATSPVTGGTLVITAFWDPLTPGASIVAT